VQVVYTSTERKIPKNFIESDGYKGGTIMKIRTCAAAVLCVWCAALLGICGEVRAQSRAAGAPPPSIHTFSTEDIASTGFFYVGGQYVGAPGKEVMDGAEYVEVMVPKKIRHSYPIVFFHGAGQTGTDWFRLRTGDPVGRIFSSSRDIQSTWWIFPRADALPTIPIRMATER
jgi:hypothetical protein